VVSAYILIQTEVGKAGQVAREIVEIKGVQQAEDVTGPYDVIVRAEARNIDELGKLVVARVQAIDGITRTLTCPVVHLWSCSATESIAFRSPFDCPWPPWCRGHGQARSRHAAKLDGVVFGGGLIQQPTSPTVPSRLTSRHHRHTCTTSSGTTPHQYAGGDIPRHSLSTIQKGYGRGVLQ
jgi:Lrp/AsnC ligand binding domain